MFNDILLFLNENSNALSLLLSILSSLLAILWSFFVFFNYGRNKKIDTKYLGKEEILKNKQIAYIELNKLLLKFQLRGYFFDKNDNERSEKFQNICFDIISQLYGEEINDEEAFRLTSDYFSIFIFMKNSKNLNNAILSLNNFYIENSLYFSDKLMNNYLELMCFLSFYNEIISIFYGIMQKYLPSKMKEYHFDDISKKLFFMFYLYLIRDLESKLNVIHKQLLEELNSNDFNLYKKQKYPIDNDTYKKLLKYIEEFNDSKNNFYKFKKYLISFAEIYLKPNEFKKFLEEFNGFELGVEDIIK